MRLTRLKVLYIAGMDGQDQIGIVTVLELAQYINDNLSQFKQLMSERMLILLPFINPNGFSSSKSFETNKSGKSFDVSHDFPFNTEECMNTSSARFLDQFFRDHLIVQTLVFKKGDPAIIYPWTHNK